MSGIPESRTKSDRVGLHHLPPIPCCIHYENKHSSPHPTLQFAVCSVISSGKLLFPWQQEQARGRQNIDREIKREWGKYRPGGHFGHIYKTVMRHSQFTLQTLSATPLSSELRAVGLKLQKERREKKQTLKEMRLTLTWCCKEIRWQCEKDTLKNTMLTRLNVSALIWGVLA